MSELEPITVPVLDWHGLWAGHVNYDAAGNYFPQDVPRGIRLAVQSPECSEPVLSKEKRWEAGSIGHGTLIYEGGRYRLWYWAAADLDDPWVKAGNVPGKRPGVFCCAESRDGFHWERPNLGLVDFAGSKENNILFVSVPTTGHRIGYTNVFLDPRGTAAERYKAIGISGRFWVDGRPASREEVKELSLKREAAGDGGVIGVNITHNVVITGGVSPDGLRWTHLPEPVMETPWLLDTQNILTYDRDIGKYVIYLRSGMKRRRAVSRYEAEEFRGPWTNHQMVLTVEPGDPPSWDIYAPGYCRHPHGAHLMFFSAFDRASGLLSLHLATSYDGQLWHRPARTPIIPADDRCGRFYAAPGLVPIGDEKWGLLVLACPGPHDRSSWTTERPNEYVWAIWKRDRLVAWQADDWAEFATTEHECAGQQLKLNVKTRQPGAFVKAEIVDGDLPNRGSAALVPPLEGYSFADCDPLSGDHLDGVVTWKGKSDLARLRGKKIHLRFQMARGSLFAFAM